MEIVASNQIFAQAVLVLIVGQITKTFVLMVQAVAIVELIVELFPQSIPVKIREQLLWLFA